MRWVGLAFIPLLAIIACVPAPGDLSHDPSHDPPRRHVQSPEAAEFAAYQARMQDLGLLRTDWDPADAPYNNDQLARNFHRIAFFAFPNDQLHIPKPLTRWEKPVRYAVVGDRNDRAEVAELMARIARLTGLDIAPSSEREANFVVLTLDEHDRQATGQALHNAAGRAFFETFLSAIHDCGAIASWTDTEPEITRAMVYLHGDLTDLYRTLCFHEEISQSFGLFNDDPTVRPSIFNDDEEFALLTRHDEYLLRILYDPRLKPGMEPAEAMPIVRTIIEELRPGA